ncbi:MAG: flagellar biosynthetic protein FliP [Planctomycetota bacterium]|jgi:flagellar biosynthetic protein FliP
MSFQRMIRLVLLVVLCGTMLTNPLHAQGLEEAINGLMNSAQGLASDGQGTTGAATAEDGAKLSSAVEIAVLLTALSLLPAILISITSFTRIVIVLSFVRRALSVNELPPNPVIIGLALFLTSFVMAPVAERIYEKSWEPYQEGKLAPKEASEVAWGELRVFLIANTRETELELFAEMSGYEPEVEHDQIKEGHLPLTVIVPAFVLSELKTAFQMGFLLFLPFLVIDLVVSSILMSMGMFMLPPVMISTPFKILVFVLVDGWHLICQSVVSSFITA